MRRLGNLLAVLIAWTSASGAALPSDWQFQQPFEVSQGGLVKLELPRDTLGKSRPGLEDLRLHNAAGNEVPYLIERPRPSSQGVLPAKSFRPALTAATTVLIIETGLTPPIKAVTLDSPATAFIKAVEVEGSSDRVRWEPIAMGQPVFRQPNGASQLQIAIPPRAWNWLRLTMDDRRSQPVPFTGARVHTAAAEPAPVESIGVTIAQRHENPGETRLTLNLGAANLDVAAIHVETSEPLFTRAIAVAVPQVSQESMSEQTIARGSIYRMAVEGQPSSEMLRISVNSQVRSGELLLLIRNGDSPPLSISAVRVERRPVYMLFNVREPSLFHLLTGNPRCEPPKYDLAGFGADLRSAPLSPIVLPPAERNPSYRTPEVLPGIPQEGADVDLSAWKYRKTVKLARAGAQTVELDLDILSHAQPSFSDVRLIRDAKQVPYVLERTSIARAVTPTVTITNDAKDRTVSRWILQLPRPGLPINRLSCTSETPLFQRELTFFEELADERGAAYRRYHGSVTWMQTPDRQAKDLVHVIPAPLASDRLFIETRNGDNPPVQLGTVRLFYSATRVLFKANAEDVIHLYYGNPEAAPPRYDIALVGGQLLSAEKGTGEIGREEQLKKSSWAEGRRPGVGGVVFWGALALVVVVLLAVIARLLPKTPPAG